MRMPASSAPSPDVTGLRPVATRRTSAAREWDVRSCVTAWISTPLSLAAAAGDTRSREHLDALLAKRLFELRRNGLVFGRREAGQQLNQGDVAAEPAEDGRELDTDRARSKNHQRLWYFAQVYRFVAGDDSSAVEHDIWNAARRGSRSNDDVSCRQASACHLRRPPPCRVRQGAQCL